MHTLITEAVIQMAVADLIHQHWKRQVLVVVWRGRHDVAVAEVRLCPDVQMFGLLSLSKPNLSYAT